MLVETLQGAALCRVVGCAELAGANAHLEMHFMTAMTGTLNGCTRLRVARLAQQGCLTAFLFRW